ncbi:MAG: hypothetical protein KBS98_00920 [Flavobacterium sp.]|nr:hypothetical protein [Candidatus Neoflavobacterium equi]
MKKFAGLILLFVLMTGCKQEIKQADLVGLNGYWEIEEVILPDGSKKDYTINTTVDYFQLDKLAGIRKKVMPQLDGTYLANDLVENFTISEKEGTWTVVYKTPYNTWKETLLTLDAESLIFQHENGIKYIYKKSTGFSLKDEKKI